MSSLFLSIDIRRTYIETKRLSSCLSSRLVIDLLFNTPTARPEIDYIVWTIQFTFVNQYEREAIIMLMTYAYIFNS